MNALVAVGGVDAEGDQCGAHVVAGLQRGGAVGAVVFEDIALVGDVEFLTKLNNAARQVIVERTAHVGHADGGAELAGVLARRGGAIVDGQHLGDVLVQCRGGTGADLLGDGEQRVAVHRQLHVTVLDRFGGGQEQKRRRPYRRGDES